MFQQINKGDFRDAFNRAGRGSQFSYEALGALFDYIEELEADFGNQLELDPVAICCEWAEMEDLADFNDQYGQECSTLEEVQALTQVIDLDGDGFVIASF